MTNIYIEQLEACAAVVADIRGWSLGDTEDARLLIEGLEEKGFRVEPIPRSNGARSSAARSSEEVRCG